MDVTAKIPSLDALPVIGIEDDLQTAVQARAKLKATYIMVAQILAAPSGLTPMLKMTLNSVLFHVKVALSTIDKYLGEGHPSNDQVGGVPNLMAAIKLHIGMIRQAKPLWDAWLKTEEPPEAPAPLPKAGAIDPFKAAAVVASATPKASAFEGMSKPTPLKTYLTIGAVAAGVLILMKLMK